MMKRCVQAEHACFGAISIYCGLALINPTTWDLLTRKEQRIAPVPAANIKDLSVILRIAVDEESGEVARFNTRRVSGVILLPVLFFQDSHPVRKKL